jgi:hypothetical protein
MPLPRIIEGIPEELAALVAERAKTTPPGEDDGGGREGGVGGVKRQTSNVVLR